MSGTRPGEVRWFRVAVQALAVIATAEGPCPSSAIAEGLASHHAAFLRRVLAQLARSGIVEAQEGRAGGYRLARPAADITLAEIYAAVQLVSPEEPCATSAAASTRTEPAGACAVGGASSGCLGDALDGVAAEAEQAVVHVFSRYSLASVMARAAVPKPS